MPLAEKREMIRIMLADKSLFAKEVDGLLPIGMGVALRMVYSFAFAIAQIVLLMGWRKKIVGEQTASPQNREIFNWLIYFTLVIGIMFLILVLGFFIQNTTSLNILFPIAVIVLFATLSLSGYLVLKPNILYGLTGLLQPHMTDSDTAEQNKKDDDAISHSILVDNQKSFNPK
jgi:uncharacterized integral membrane protein